MARDIDITERALELVIGLAVGALLIAAFAGVFILGSEPTGFAFLLVIGGALLLAIALASVLIARRRTGLPSTDEAALLEIENPQMAPPSEADVLYPDSTIRVTAAEENAGVPEKHREAEPRDPVAAELHERNADRSGLRDNDNNSENRPER